MEPKYVFINCPFDNRYFPILKSLLFSLIYMGFDPLISETSDSGDTRLHKLVRLMRDSKFSIHDISRMEPLKAKELPRFNMAFECGVDFGIKFSGSPQYTVKKF